MVKTAEVCSARCTDCWQIRAALDFCGRMYFKRYMSAQLLTRNSCCPQKLVEMKRLGQILFQN